MGIICAERREIGACRQILDLALPPLQGNERLAIDIDAES
jgi:hypothetical protein